MKHYLFILFLGLFIGPSIKSQNRTIENNRLEAYFNLRGSVYEKSSFTPYKDVKILVNGGSYTITDSNGMFSVRAKIGDELIISHDDFETIYHTITGNERINIEVIDDLVRGKANKKRYQSIKAFDRLIDSAETYLKKSAEKSLQFVEDALNEEISTQESAIAHELLGDIYFYWKQYDLAISAFRISLQNSVKASSQLKLARTYLMNGQPELSLQTYNNISSLKLSNYQIVEFHEGLGDTFLELKNYSEALNSYNEGVTAAKRYLIEPKLIDLNSKIAEAFSKQGDNIKAKDYFSNSLQLAKQQSRKRAVEEQIKVAEFNSEIRNYESEIALRKAAIEGLKTIEMDSVIPNESPNTIQKQNYKIGNAYYLKKDFDSAIPYFEKSIKESNEKGDLVVKKDAIRKLSETYISKGDLDKGIASINEYKDVVDELYVRKEQEISRAARFSRNIAEQQNRITSLENDRQLSISKYQLTQERNKRQQLIIYSLIGGLLLLLVTGFFMYKYIKQQKLANHLLALKSLRSQMNPHFIFNALNSVNSFIATNDERSANKYLSDFSNLMRAVLENSEEDFIPLNKEIELIEMYTKLEHYRFQDKFDYELNVDGNIDLNSFEIPPMLLQPYIENAVWHGLRYKKERGMLAISLKAKNEDEILISITDDGIGREKSKALKTQNQRKQKSKGMTNITKRVGILNEMHKGKIDIAVSDYRPEQEESGTVVEVTLKTKIQ